MNKETRRSFVKKFGTASALAAGGFLNWNPRAMGANEKVVLGLIGGRNQGRGDALRAIKVGAEIKTFCDVDQAILDQVNPDFEKAQGKAPGITKDFQRVLDDKDIDGVIIATPDHWHARMTLLACQAGKDVYIEKPLSQTIEEGHLMRDAGRKYKRVVQVGTMGRSAEHYQTAIEYVKTGKLGKICEINTWACQVRESIGNPPDSPAPSTVDYNAWLGPAPKRPFNTNRFHYNWRFFWDYGNTELGNMGVHMLDVAMWGIESLRGTEKCLPTRISGAAGIYWLKDAKEVPDTQVMTYDFGDLLLTWELRSFAEQNPVNGKGDGIAFNGSDASLVASNDGWKVYSKDGKTGPVFVSHDPYTFSGLHEKNFIDCIRSRDTPHADVEIGRLSTTICHLGNICTHLGRSVVFDPKTETFGDDKAANAYLTKQYREGYGLPKV